MSTLNGPGEGTWSVFAAKVVEERDRLRGVCDLRLHIMERLEKERDEAQWHAEGLRAALALVEAERDEARAKIAGLPAWQKGCEQALGDLADAEEAIARLYTERDEARAEAKRRLDELNMVQSQLTLALHARDEARAEVQDYREQLRKLPDANRVASQDAYRRGAETMREACAIRGGDKAYERMTKFRPLASEMKQAVRDAIRALPIPEDKP